jgi:hypothetical protein
MGGFDQRVDFAAQNRKIDRLGQQRLGAAFQRLAGFCPGFCSRREQHLRSVLTLSKTHRSETRAARLSVAHIRERQLCRSSQESRDVQPGRDRHLCEVWPEPGLFRQCAERSLLPNLTYMLSSPDVPTLDANWAKFAASPEWEELSRRPGLSDAEIVSNITNLYLSPLPCSQI